MKRIFALILVLCTVFSLAACGGEEKKETPVTLDLAAMYTKMEASLPEMVPLNEDAMLNRYGIRAELVSEALVYICLDGLKADEIWLLKAADDAAMTDLEKLAQSRMQAKDEESVTYSPEQNKIVKQGKILKRGDYLALIVSPDVAALEAIFNG